MHNTKITTLDTEYIHPITNKTTSLIASLTLLTQQKLFKQNTETKKYIRNEGFHLLSKILNLKVEHERNNLVAVIYAVGVTFDIDELAEKALDKNKHLYMDIIVKKQPYDEYFKYITTCYEVIFRKYQNEVSKISVYNYSNYSPHQN